MTQLLPLVGTGYDIHPFASDRPLIIGGVTIPHTHGLGGHSDGDVLLHAISDAILAACGLPDLGSRFPATDEQYRGADSSALLSEVVLAAQERGLRFGNLSAVVNAEVPRIAPHVESIRTRVAALLAPIDLNEGPSSVLDRISLTPKRGEGIGAIGRQEGIAVWATVMMFQIIE